MVIRVDNSTVKHHVVDLFVKLVVQMKSKLLNGIRALNNALCILNSEDCTLIGHALPTGSVAEQFDTEQDTNYAQLVRHSTRLSE